MVTRRITVVFFFKLKLFPFQTRKKHHEDKRCTLMQLFALPDGASAGIIWVEL